jgi:hypothetical protein
VTQKPVFTAKTDFFDEVRLLILWNLLKAKRRSMFPAYMARPLIFNSLQTQSIGYGPYDCRESYVQNSLVKLKENGEHSESLGPIALPPARIGH